MVVGERRIDQEDGVAYTWEEFETFYKKKYKAKALAAYWEDCEIKSKKPKGKGKGKAAKEEKPEKAEKAEKADKPKPKVKAKAVVEKKSAGNFKVCVCGGAGGIGQPLSLLMGLDPNVKELCIFDLSVAMVPPAGVAADLGHLERKNTVTGYQMDIGQKPVDHLQECLTGCHLVLIPAGMPRKPGQSRDDLFKINADIAKGIVEACSKYCPGAMLGLVVNPVNSIVPAMAELYKKKGLDPMKIVGISTLDVVRANKFVGIETGKNPNFINVPVIGGHAGKTILPLFSQDKVSKMIDAEKIPAMDSHVQDAGTDVVNAKNGKGSATLSMAYAGARLGKSILAGLLGKRRTECAYVKSDITDLPYFASKVVFGETGIVKVLPIGELSDYEKTRLEEVKEQLKGEIQTGLDYAEVNSLCD
mmetsp:Transcript_42951/g.77638  ORF Transcript_42951/g.77638 Transcript_42951/m.77638 type:complete len:417 (-) Transcript_42951:233-1483(-)